MLNNFLKNAKNELSSKKQSNILNLSNKDFKKIKKENPNFIDWKKLEKNSFHLVSKKDMSFPNKETMIAYYYIISKALKNILPEEILKNHLDLIENIIIQFLISCNNSKIFKENYIDFKEFQEDFLIYSGIYMYIDKLLEMNAPYPMNSFFPKELQELMSHIREHYICNYSSIREKDNSTIRIMPNLYGNVIKDINKISKSHNLSKEETTMLTLNIFLHSEISSASWNKTIDLWFPNLNERLNKINNIDKEAFDKCLSIILNSIMSNYKPYEYSYTMKAELNRIKNRTDCEENPEITIYNNLYNSQLFKSAEAFSEIINIIK